MNQPTWLFIVGCWIAWVLYWLIMSVRTKHTVERGDFIGYRVVMIVVIAGCVAVGALLHISTHSRLWHTTLALGVVTDCIVVAGVAFTVWARITLGRNWSVEPTFKQDHELIESGPYALVRHPIYTGLLLMALGTVINIGRTFGVAVYVGLCAALWWKSRQEERLMSRHFPEAYGEYKARVRAIVPFVL
jgi:protein-S-isoprenylcysteine O-methyltransferase Ste14